MHRQFAHGSSDASACSGGAGEAAAPPVGGSRARAGAGPGAATQAAGAHCERHQRLSCGQARETLFCIWTVYI